MLCDRQEKIRQKTARIWWPDLQQAQAEQEEEFISNTLLKKIHSLKKEKEALAMNYEKEEEFLTNDLSRNLAQVKGGLWGTLTPQSYLFGVFLLWNVILLPSPPPPAAEEREGTVGADSGAGTGAADLQTDQEDRETRERRTGQAVHSGEGVAIWS